jgi:hypothetical protein
MGSGSCPYKALGRSLLPRLYLQGRGVTAEGSFEFAADFGQPLRHIGPLQFGIDITSRIDFVS